MVTARDKLGLVIAIVVVGGLLWYGMSRSTSAGSPGSPATTSNSIQTPNSIQSGAQPAVAHYLAQLARIHAGIMKVERRGIRFDALQATPSGKAFAPAMLRQLDSMPGHYTRTAMHVQALHPPAGFARAQALLVRVYQGEAQVYAATDTFVHAAQAKQGDMLTNDIKQVLKQEKALNQTASTFIASLEQATNTAGVPTPTWIKGLTPPSAPNG